MQKQSTISVILFFLFFHSLPAQTNVSGGIFQSTFWLKSKSPYIVTDNLVIFDNVTLTIQAGVVVKFNDNTSLEVRNGKLIALGTKQDSIIFTSNNQNPQKGSWKGITVVSNTDPLGQGEQIKMAYCKGLYSELFLNLDIAYHTPYTFDNCVFENNKKAFYDGFNRGVRINNSLFCNNDIGIDQGLQYIVSKSIFDGNKKGAIAVLEIDSCKFINNTEYALLPYGSTTNNLFLNNKIASKEGYFNNANNKFTGNVIKDNEIGVQILTFFTGSINFSGNTICNNKIYNIQRGNIDGQSGNNNFTDLSNNCWCTNDLTLVEEKILDAKDDVSLGLVTVIPFSGSCNNSLVSSIQADENENNFILSPNPTTGEVTILNDKTKLQFLTISDLNGKIMKIQKGETESNTINLSEYPNGIYFIKIQTLTNFTVKRVMKF